jgi:hypothetical protein
MANRGLHYNHKSRLSTPWNTRILIRIPLIHEEVMIKERTVC